MGSPPNFFDPSAQESKYAPWNPTVTKVTSAAPCLFQAAAKFFVFYDPESPFTVDNTVGSYVGPGKDRCTVGTAPERDNTCRQDCAGQHSNDTLYDACVFECAVDYLLCPENTNPLFADIDAKCFNGYPYLQGRLCQRDETTRRREDKFSAATLWESVRDRKPWTLYRATSDQAARLAELNERAKTNSSQALADEIAQLMGTIEAYIKEESKGYDGIGVTTWTPMNVPLAVRNPIQTIVDEINILGVAISSPLFSGTAPNKFPSGVIITSKHPKVGNCPSALFAALFVPIHRPTP